MALPMKRMPTVMTQGHTFAQVPSVGIERSVFDRSHGYKTTFDAGLLIPVLVDYVMPGDTFSCRMTAFARLTTPIKPLMDNMYLESFFFFVPFRLIWTNFVKMMGEQVNPGDSISFTVPQNTGMPAAGFALGTLGDYFGLPTAGTPAVTASISHSALPFRAYQLIYNQWFRDENLINSVNPATVGDGPDTYNDTTLPLKRGKRHDYFTSCLTALQKGAAISLPLGSLAPVIGLGSLGTTGAAGGAGRRETGGGTATYDFENVVATDTNIRMKFSAASSAFPEVYANLTAATAATINDIRLAFQQQAFLERDARGGTRYTELVYSHFKVKSDDARLQRAEYLGGGSTPVSIAPVAQQTQTGLTGGSTPIGNLSGVGAVLAQGHGFHKSFTEHGVIIGIVNVRADLTYSQGIERFWSYSTRFDFPWPVFAHLGEQAVLNKEIFATGAAADANVFGYQERYAECRYKPSKVTGLFRPTAAGTLELWHLSEKFGALPTLGQTFIEDQTETILDTRVAVPSEPDFYFDSWFEYKCARPLPVFGVPVSLGRF